jgi:hypothetical protein
MESNCFFVRRDTFRQIDGFDSRFQEPGGGLAILDIFKTLVSDLRREYVVLLGEGSFHQFHGGIASNAAYAEHPWRRFAAEYERIRGEPFTMAIRRPLLFGAIPPQAVAWTRLCARVGLDWWEQRDRLGEKISPETFGYALQAARSRPDDPAAGELRQELFALQRHCDLLTQRCRELEAELVREGSAGGWRQWFARRKNRKRPPGQA